MAVQAAIMNPQFLNFCFPGSVMEYDVEKSLDEGSILGEAETEEDYKETTRDLLSFIDSASSNIKLALDKPVKSKRKVNHRKYLQKQIKRCTGIIAPSNAPEPPPPVKRHGSPPTAQTSSTLHTKNLPKRDGVHANLQSKSLAALFSPVQDVRGGEKAKKPPLRHRNLPPSFFTEPANCTRVNSATGTMLKDLDRGTRSPWTSLSSWGRIIAAWSVSRTSINLCLSEHIQRWEDWRHCPMILSTWLEAYCTPLSLNLQTQHKHAWLLSLRCYICPIEDSSLCTLAFPSFFTDCSVPPVTYDLSGAFSRPNYSSL
uniref:Family with sequence similarity 181 member B n=1 Tax=Neogobius melanostomus TaxID=47308 RepID=A0A8C6TK92_9GOBI